MSTHQIYMKLPGLKHIGNMARSKGWFYIVAWAHRISGVFLALYLVFHVITLSSLATPDQFVEKMQFFSRYFPGYLEWFLAIPVIYHSLNGGRLILYEIFGFRNDRTLVRSVLIISILYLLLIGIFMINGNQAVTSFLFWSQITIGSLCLTFLTVNRLRATGASIFWKFQRISGSFLFLMIPAHMLFMHLDPHIGRDVQVIISRMSNGFMKCVDIGLVVSALYHLGYGLIAISLDYISDRRTQIIIATTIILLVLILGFIGIKTVIFI